MDDIYDINFFLHQNKKKRAVIFNTKVCKHCQKLFYTYLPPNITQTNPLTTPEILSHDKITYDEDYMADPISTRHNLIPWGFNQPKSSMPSKDGWLEHCRNCEHHTRPKNFSLPTETALRKHERSVREFILKANSSPSRQTQFFVKQPKRYSITIKFDNKDETIDFTHNPHTDEITSIVYKNIDFQALADTQLGVYNIVLKNMRDVIANRQ